MSQKMAAAEEMKAPESGSSVVTNHSGEFPIPSAPAENSAAASGTVNKPVLTVNTDQVQPEEEAVYSSRATIVDPNEAAPQSGEKAPVSVKEQAPARVAVESQRTVTAARTHRLLDSFKDPRLESDDVDEAFKAVDDHVAYQDRMVKEVEHHVLDQQRQQQHFELTRKSRGFFTKLKDFASNVWSGATPEETAKGIQGSGGIRGLFMGQQARQAAIMRQAGINSQELKKIPDPKPETKPVVQADAEFPLPMNRLFERKEKSAVTAQPDPEFPLPMKKLFERKEKPAVTAQPDPDYPLPMNASFIDDIKSAASGIFNSIRNGISSFFKSKTVRKVAVAGAVVGGTLVAGASSCGKGCTHPWHIDVPPVASNSAPPNGDGGSAPTEVMPPAPSASEVVINDPAPVAPVPDVTPVDKEEKKDTKKSDVKTAPKNAKVSHLPKPYVVAKKPEPKVEQPKPGEAKECTDSTKPAELNTCLVKAEDALKLRASLYEQLDEQKKALEKVYAPIANGPAYVSMNPYKTEKQPITFVEANTVGAPAEKNPITEMNAENKKIVEDGLAKAKTMIEGAKTMQDFSDAVAFMKAISDRIDALTAERGKQIAASIDAANQMNAQFAKDKITDIEKQSGKKVDVTVDDTKVATTGGETITHSTINIPASRKLLEGSEADMLAPTLGSDPDKVIVSVQKKLEYYNGLLQFNRSLDDVRVKQRPASARMAEAARVGTYAPAQGGVASRRNVASAK